MYSVDINREYQTIKSKLFRAALLFSLIFTVVLVADVLLVVLANEEYLVNLIISIIISILFTWFAIYFISNIYSDLDARYRYFKGYAGGLKPMDEVVFIKMSDELCYINGLYVYPLVVKYNNGLSSDDKIIFTLNKDLKYVEGDKLTITTYQRVIIQAEKHAWTL